MVLVAKTVRCKWCIPGHSGSCNGTKLCRMMAGFRAAQMAETVACLCKSTANSSVEHRFVALALCRLKADPAHSTRP